MITKATEIFIGTGADLNTDTTSISAITQQLNFVSGDMTVVKGGSITITTDPKLFAVNKYPSGDLKRSFPINGTSVTRYNGESYKPTARNVWTIGYDRLAATGLIEVNTSTDYNFTIHFKNDKWMYSERPELFNYVFTVGATDTESTIATTITNAINNSAYGSQPSGIKVIHAVKIGNGTGIYGLTGASHYGVEIWGLDINQFANTTYTDNLVYFDVHVNDATGFGSTTTVTETQAMFKGIGTYNQVYNLENKWLGYEGVLNRTLWPIPVQTYLASSAGVTSGSLASLVASGLVGEDQLTFSGGSLVPATQLPAGSIVVLDSGSTNVSYEIKYWISSSAGAGVAVLTTPLSATVSSVTTAGKAWYDIITIETTDVDQTLIGVGQFVTRVIQVASPAIISSATNMTTASTGSAALQTLLNAYMTTTPGRFANISI